MEMDGRYVGDDGEFYMGKFVSGREEEGVGG